MSLLQDYSEGLRGLPSRPNAVAIQRFHAWVLQAAGRVGRPDLRDEIAATVVLRLMERPLPGIEALLADPIAAERRLKGYLRRMIANLAHDAHRRERRLEGLPDDDRSPAPAEADDLPHVELEAVLAAVHRVTEACVASLSPRYRAEQAAAFHEACELAFGRISYDDLVRSLQARDPQLGAKTAYDRLNKRHTRARRDFLSAATRMYDTLAIAEVDYEIFVRFVRDFLPQRATEGSHAVSEAPRRARLPAKEGEHDPR